MLLLLFLLIPRPVGYVNDFAGIIESPWKTRLERLAYFLRDSLRTEMAVLTLKDLTDFSDIEEAAFRIYEDWGIGKKGEDRGFLILVVVKMRKVRVEVGYGLEGVLTDGFVGSVLRKEVIPLFKRGRFGEGLYRGAFALAVRVAKEEGVEIGGGKLVSTPKKRGKRRRKELLIWLLFFFCLFFPMFLRKKKGMPLIVFGPFGGFGGGSSGGGFGGFGGGASGGGGATGGW
jgi:uncharacterized protein